MMQTHWTNSRGDTMKPNIEQWMNRTEQAEAELRALRESIATACAGTGCNDHHQLRDSLLATEQELQDVRAELQEAKHDCTALATEVRAWRKAIGGSDADLTTALKRVDQTDKSGALKRTGKAGRA